MSDFDTKKNNINHSNQFVPDKIKTDFSSTSETIRNGKPLSDSVNLSSKSESVVLSSEDKNKNNSNSKNRKPPTTINSYKTIVEHNIRNSRARIHNLEAQKQSMLKAGKSELEIKEVQLKIDQEAEKLDKLYRKRENTIHLDKQEHIAERKEVEEFNKKQLSTQVSNYDRNSSKMTFEEQEFAQEKINSTKKKVKESTEQTQDVINGKENFVSKTRTTYNNFQKKIQGKIPGLSKFNEIRNQASNKIGSAVKNAISGISKVISMILKFLFSNPVGWCVLAIIAILTVLAYSSGNVPLSSGESYNQKADVTMIEYRSWNTYFNDEEVVKKFKDQYNTSVSATSLTPIIYTFKDSEKYNEIVNKFYDKYKLKDFDGPAEYEKQVYDDAVKEYSKDLDLYELREMFLDEVKYTYSYLAREYSDWEELKPHAISTSQVPEGGNKQKYINSAVSDLEEELKNQALEHSEAIAITKSVQVTVNYEQGHDRKDCKDVEKQKCVNSVCETVTEQECHNVHWTTDESYTTTVSVTSYKVRDITKSEWVIDKNDHRIDKNVSRESLRQDINELVLNDYEYKAVIENGYEKPWQTRYIENDTIIKRLRIWTLRNYQEVYSDIACEYNPITTNPNYAGDEFTMVKNDPIYGKVTFNIDKRKLYKEYYAAETNKLIFQENLFTDEAQEEYEQEMLDWKMIFMSAGLDNIEPPDFTNDAAWRSYEDPDIIGDNEYGVSLYGQCTWFAEGMFIQTYGYPMGFTANGNNVAENLVKEFPDFFELSEEPVAGAIFSKGVGAEYGHTGMIMSASDDGKITIVHGNVKRGQGNNLTSESFLEAMTDWEIAEVDISYFASHYGESYPYLFANPLEGAVQE